VPHLGCPQRENERCFRHRATLEQAEEEIIVSAKIPEKYADLFQKRAFGSLGTLMPDGSPQVTPVWIDLEDGRLVVNSAKGRAKDRNMRRDARVSIAVIDPENPYRYLEVRGRVVEISEKGADQHIDKMAKKYLGKDSYPFRKNDEVRVRYVIEPEHFNSMG
jgi:PPOX class probable F420-dependent enzyme